MPRGLRFAALWALALFASASSGCGRKSVNDQLEETFIGKPSTPRHTAADGGGATQKAWEGPPPKFVLQPSSIPTQGAPSSSVPPSSVAPADVVRSSAPSTSQPTTSRPSTPDANSPDAKPPEPEQNPALKLHDNRYALLVAVRTYSKSGGLSSLKFSDADVEGLAEVLRDSGFRPENVLVMTQKRGAEETRFLPTRDNIRRELRGLLRDRKPDDLVFVGLAGHGVQFRGDADSFFCPVDADLSESDKAKQTLLSLGELYRDLESSAAGFKLLVCDACRNDPFSSSTRRATVDLDSVTRPHKLKPPGGVAAFFSCSEGEVAFEDEQLAHGVFFHYVIEGLRGAADVDKDASVSLPELEMYATKRVSDRVRAKFDASRQMPQLVNNSRGVMTLAAVPPKPAKIVRAPEATKTPVRTTNPTAADLQAERLGRAPAPGENVVEWAIRALLSDDVFAQEAACNRLAVTEPDDAHLKDVSNALVAKLSNSMSHGRLDVHLQAMVTWRTEDGIKAVIDLLAEKSSFTRDAAMKALAKMPTKPGASAVAARMTDFFDAKSASAALRKMGPVAEDAVLRLADSPAASMRAEAYAILAAIGDDGTLTKLRALHTKEKDRAAKPVAKQAVDDLKERLAASPKGKPRTGDAKK